MKKKMLIATLLSSVLALSQPLPVLSAAYAYEELLPETAADLPEHPSGQPILDCNEVLTVNDEPSMVTITVSGKEDFPPGYTVSMEEPDETEFTETVCRLEDFLNGIQTESQLAFRLMIQDEAGVPVPLHDDYIVRMTMDSIESLSGKNLYHEKQDGTWENIVYTTDIDPETESPYIEFLTEDPGMFLFVNESIVLPEENNLDENQEDEISDMQEETLTCQDILYDGQFAEVSVSAEQPFPLDSSLRIQQLPDEILEEKMENLNMFISADMQLVLPLNLMAVDAAGIEQSLGGNYSVNLMLEDTSVLHGAKLYHELLDGSWEELLFSEASLSCISYASFNGLGNFFFVTGHEKEEENENDSLNTSEQPPADEQLSNEDPKEEAEPADEPEAPTVPVEDNSSNETEESVTEKDELTDDTESTVTDDDTANKADTVPPKKDGGESQPEKPMDGIEVSEGDDITNGTDPIEDPDDTSDEDGNVLPDENNPSTPEDTEGAADESEDNVSEENDEILSEETEAGTVEGETDILEDIIPPEEDIREFTYEDDDVIVNARVSSESGIPETAVLFADALEEGSDAYLAAYNEVKDSLVLSEDQKLLFAPYDVYFMNGENRIEPAGGIVQIEMFFKEALFGTSPGSSPTFVTHIRGDGVVEQLENTSDMKDCISFEVSSFSIMGPTMVTNAEEDGTPESREVAPIIIDEYKVRFSSGADLVDDKYIWKPTDPAPGHLFVYRIDYTMSGTFATDKGAFKIELPLHILKDRNGNWADTFDCPYLSEDELTEDMEVPEFVYKIDEANNMAIIYNYKPYPTGEAGYIEFSYATNESTLKYTDMCNSTSVHTKVYATNDASTVTAEADAEPVYVNTHATINYTQKKAPFFYDSWQPAWGEKAPDADEYLYLVWTIRTNINKNTSPYDFYLNDVFTDLNGSVVGYRFAGQTSYSETNHVDGIESYGDRYDYVLTKHSRAEAEKLLEKAGTYEVHNDVTATVSPIDHLDENTSADSSIDWWYEIPEYIRPTGHFWAEKYGVFGEYSIVRDSEDVSDYSLGEFQDNKKSSIDNLKFYTYADAYPYPWTLADGADGTINDVLNGLYGQKKVDYQFTDDTFYLEDSEQALADADYDLTGIEWNPVIRTAEFDKESGGFVEVPTNDYKPEDNITIWVRYGSDWQKAAVYNMQQKSYQDINSTYIKKAFLRKVQFNPGIKGVRFTGSNAYFHTKIDLYPIVSLFNTDAVMDQIGKETGKTKVRLSNEATFEVTQNGSLIFERTVKGKDYIQKVKRESEITKDIIQTFNDKENEKFDVTWLANVEERYTDNDGIHYIYQQSGTFYDLLPAGAVIDVLSVSVNAGKDTLFPGEFDVHTVDNYNHSGRTMLVVTIKEPTESSYTFSYKTIHSYDSIHDYGKNLLNSVAYETGNVDIGEGFPDNGGLISDKDLMADLDKNTDAEKFLYAEARYNINIVVAANTGLRKQIKNSTDTQYSYSTIVHMNENYSYQVRLANDSMTQSKNIVFFDSLENFFQTAEEVDPTIPSDWKGTLTSISVNNLLYKGIQPVIYLSKIDELNLPRHHDLKEVVDGAPVWIEYQEFVDKYGLGAAKAIAVDARKKVDGRNFVLGQNESISFNIYMQAPENDTSGVANPITYNNIYVNRTAIKKSGDGVTEIQQFYHQDYTQAYYHVIGNIPLKKVDFTDNDTPVKGCTYRLSGTSDYGTQYMEERTSDKDGRVLFENIEKGVYDLQEISCPNGWMLDTEIYKVTITPDGKLSIPDLKKTEDNIYLLQDVPKIQSGLNFYKINSLTQSPVEGVQFRLSGTSDYGNEYLQYAISSQKGLVSFTDIECGTYELAESDVPDGYIKKNGCWTVKVDKRGVATIYDGGVEISQNEDGLYQIENEPTHSVRFLKSSTYGKDIYLEGAEFTLVGISDYGTDVNITAISGPAADGGLVTFDGLEPGTYILRETKAPAEHDINPCSYTVIVKADGSYTIDGLSETSFGGSKIYEFKDPKATGNITVVKKWVDNKTNEERVIPDIGIGTSLPTGESPLGVTITFDGNGSLFANGNATNKVIYNSSGKIVSGTYMLPHGLYGVKWYEDQECTIKADISSEGLPVTPYASDITLYAKGSTFTLRNDVDFKSMIPETATEVEFTDEKIPSNAPVIDMDADGDGGVIGWMDGSTLKVSSQIPGVPVTITGSLSQMFDGCNALTSIDMRNVDTSQVTSMSYMFRGCTNLVNLNVSTFNTSNVLYMHSMFNGCSNLQTVDVSSFNTGKVQNMGHMFNDCSSLTDLDVSGFITSSVEYMDNMFGNCSSLAVLNVSNFDTSKVQNMGLMFNNCSSLTDLDVSGFITSSVEYMGYMFSKCSNLTTLNVSNFDTSRVTSMAAMFMSCEKISTLDVSGWDVRQVTNLESTFRECGSLTDLDVSNWDISQATTIELMFYNSKNITELNVSNWNTEKVINMHGTFWGCETLTQLDVSNWNTDNVTNMEYMFCKCKNITALNVSNWNTGQVTMMNDLFNKCSSLTTLDLSKWNTSHVTTIAYMFANCTNLLNLNLSSFDTSSVTNMNGIFWGCKSLTELDLSSFNTEQVTDMYCTFYACDNLLILDLSSFTTGQVTNMDGFFRACISLNNLTVGTNFVFQKDHYLPEGNWYNSSGNVFTQDNIPSNVADTYIRR